MCIVEAWHHEMAAEIDHLRPRSTMGKDLIASDGDDLSCSDRHRAGAWTIGRGERISRRGEVAAGVEVAVSEDHVCDLGFGHCRGEKQEHEQRGRFHELWQERN